MADEHGGEGGGAAYGWWPSPWSASAAAAGKVGRSGLQRDDHGVIWWTETRPELGGRQVVVRSERGRTPVDVSPEGVSVRSRVHEYGGAAATVWNADLFYVDQADQRWYRTGAAGAHAGAPPVALTPDPPDGVESSRYADGRVTSSGDWLISVEERVAADGTTHRLVAVSTGGSQEVVTLSDGSDFVAAPRPSPDGTRLAWVSWDHPSMPWDSSEIRLAPVHEGAGQIRLGPGQTVAGGDGCSVGQPRWCHDGALVFVDDRSGWWLPYRLAPDRLGSDRPATDRLVDLRAEFHAPDWALGQSTIDELPDGSLVCRMHADGRDQLVRLFPSGSDRAAPWSVRAIDQPCVSIAGVVVVSPDSGPPGTSPRESWVGVLGSTSAEAHGVFEVPLGGGQTVRRSAAPTPEVAPGHVSVATPFETTTPSGPVPGLFFAPTGTGTPGPEGGRPPLVVFCHGGPTGSAEPGFDLTVQFFTSRGLAVACVDYRGSTGYGRAYRQSLSRRWGEADIDDCVDFAAALVAAGRCDGARMAIRGTSAGGLTALGALIRSDRFAGAAAWYGVTDLEALVADTHEFESRYVDSLVGPWPEEADIYRARSPIHHPEQVTGAVLLLQGADDPVVPADQSERFAAMLRKHGVPCRLTVFEGESHGFRRADTIEASLSAELEFYRSLFGDAPGAHAPDPVVADRP
jgi:dipeptidyl aminopeptidase/acylaminoacyl peptidase